jgi:hypothetical protein
MSQNELFVDKSKWANAYDVWVLQTKVGRFVIRRARRGSEEFRLWINGVQTSHYGTVEKLMVVVDGILKIQEQTRDRDA